MYRTTDEHKKAVLAFLKWREIVTGTVLVNQVGSTGAKWASPISFTTERIIPVAIGLCNLQVFSLCTQHTLPIPGFIDPNCSHK